MDHNVNKEDGEFWPLDYARAGFGDDFNPIKNMENNSKAVPMPPFADNNREETLLKRISELEKEVQSLEDQLRFLKAKDLEVRPKTYSFWHESDNLPKNTNDSKYPALYLFNQQMDFEDNKG